MSLPFCPKCKTTADLFINVSVTADRSHIILVVVVACPHTHVRNLYMGPAMPELKEYAADMARAFHWKINL